MGWPQRFARRSTAISHLALQQNKGSRRDYSRSAGVNTSRESRADDVVITFARRTALTRAKKGALADTPSDQLLRSTLQTRIKLSGIDTALIEDVIVGTCHPPSPCYEARAAALAAGIPESTPVETVNRLCGSGLMAVRHISDSIRVGDIDVGLAVGYESMSSRPRPTPEFKDKIIQGCASAVDCAKPMGWTSEMLSLEYDVSKRKQDEYGLLSHQRAAAAQEKGRFDSEIMPITTTILSDRDDPLSSRKEIVVDKDDGIRHSLTFQDLEKARPAFKGMGDERSTGPNSSQVTDGGAMVIMARRRVAERLDLPILATHVATAVVGVPPRVMGIGPTAAIPAILQRTGLTIEDIDLFEINEAFGSMYAYCVESLRIPLNKVNVNGGAIALGHPLGATGVRQVVTGVYELLARRSKGSLNREQILCTSMCIGSGMGAAAIFVV